MDNQVGLTKIVGGAKRNNMVAHSRKPATFGFLHGGAGTNTLVLGVPEILTDAPMLSQQLRTSARIHSHQAVN